MTSGLLMAIDFFSSFRDRLYVDGWAFHPDADVVAVDIELPGGTSMGTGDYGRPSPDVAAHHGERADACRFSIDMLVSGAVVVADAHLIFTLKDAPEIVVDVAACLEEQMKTDPYNRAFSKFFDRAAMLDGPTVVEIGSRKSPGHLYAERLPPASHYVGFDIKGGPNVDVVGDAHHISRYFSTATVDGVFSLSTIEHLAMPWKAVIELNVILKTHGLVFLATHQTWPVHEAPWDYWRLSEYAWGALLNAATGFEIVDVGMGSPASVVADHMLGGTVGLEREPAFLNSWVLARKTGPTTLRWDVDLAMITDQMYPG